MSKPVLLYFEYVGAWYSEHLLMKLVITKSNAQKTMVSYSWCTFDGAIFSIAQGLCVSLIDNSFTNPNTEILSRTRISLIRAEESSISYIQIIPSCIADYSIDWLSYLIDWLIDDVSVKSAVVLISRQSLPYPSHQNRMAPVTRPRFREVDLLQIEEK